MELKQIRYFLAVAEELHFGRAAEKLHIAEQPLGYQIRRLEEELGFKLFDRTTRVVTLTPAGESLARDAGKLLEQADRAADTAGRIARGQAGVIRLGYESATVASILPDYVKLFRAEYPEIDLVLIEYSKGGLQALREEEINACLVTRYERLPKSVEFHPIFGDDAVIAISADHQLAAQKALSLGDMEGVRYLGYGGEESGPVNRFLAQLAASSDIETPVYQEAETYLALLGLVSAGLGFTIVTGAMAGLFSDKVAYRLMVDPAVRVDYGLALRQGEAAPTADALRTVARHLARLMG